MFNLHFIIAKMDNDGLAYASDKNLTLRINGGTRRSNTHISHSLTEFEIFINRHLSFSRCR